MKIYHNPRCSKSRQTLELIRKAGIQPKVIEYLKEPLTALELKQIVSMLGISPEALIRKGEADFVSNYKGKSLSDEQWIEAMVKFPKLIERPIVVAEKKAVLGRPPEKVLELL